MRNPSVLTSEDLSAKGVKPCHEGGTCAGERVVGTFPSAARICETAVLSLGTAMGRLIPQERGDFRVRRAAVILVYENIWFMRLLSS